MTRIQELLAARGCRISYSSPHRWVRRRNWQRRQGGTVRDGRGRAQRGGGAGLRPSGPGPRPGDGPPPHGVGADRGAGPLQAQLRLAHLQPEAGGRHRGLGGGLGLLRRHPQVPGHRQLPRRGGGRRRAAPQPHPGLPGILPAPGVHSRPRPGETPQGQAQGGARAVQYVRERFFKGGDFDGLAHPQGRSGTLVP